MIALPLIRKAQEDAPNGLMSEKEAEELLKTCMKVLFYRDARSLNKVSYVSIIAIISSWTKREISPNRM